jgi:PmbA/TldA metallopeptidase C-terminal domain
MEPAVTSKCRSSPESEGSKHNERSRSSSVLLSPGGALEATGHAAREDGGGVTVGYANLFLEPGPWAPEEILRTVEPGLYVTELIGFGVNFPTGDYLRGAVGFWIEDGKLAYPVEEITIAGNLRQMLHDVEMVGRDLAFRDQTAAPTLKIARRAWNRALGPRRPRPGPDDSGGKAPKHALAEIRGDFHRIVYAESARRGALPSRRRSPRAASATLSIPPPTHGAR